MRRSELPASPSAEANAWLADPANRQPDALDLVALPAARAEGLALAEESERALCAQHLVTAAWRDVAGIRCLEVTPETHRSDQAILYLFGGGFISGGALQDLQIIAPIAAKTGMRVIAPEYRLAPEHPWPAALEDVQTVAAELTQAGPCAICGESAGGNLALCVTQWIIAQRLPAPSALALMSPASDLTEAYDTGDIPDDPSLRPRAVMQVSQTYAGGQPLEDPRLSPLFGAFAPNWPATLITTGTRDLFVGQCRRLHDTLRQTGAEAHLRVWPGLWHVFEYYPDIPEAALSLSEIAAFLTTKDKTTHA
ncbi:alpha/beta hydrolase [Roseovarius sp. 2305UL8-3]|uniref:alpha/beta hydrolase n=1 Tax=Roseovarius conchicola TaxID=3121636 RepID=UPI0035292E3A